MTLICTYLGDVLHLWKRLWVAQYWDPSAILYQEMGTGQSSWDCLRSVFYTITFKALGWSLLVCFVLNLGPYIWVRRDFFLIISSTMASV